MAHGAQNSWADGPGMGRALWLDGSGDYDLTAIGINAALLELNRRGGGIGYIPSDAHVLITNTPIQIPNRVALVGIGSQVPGLPTFYGNASTNVTAFITNLNQDGTQQMVGLRSIQIDGTSATATYGIYFKRVFSGTYIEDCRVVSMSNIGIQLDGTTTSAQGPYWIRNTVTGNNGGDGIVINEGARQVVLENIESDAPGATSACVKIVATTSSSAQSIGCVLRNLYCETSQAGQNALIIDSAANVQVDGITHAVPSGSAPTTLIIIKGAGNAAGGSSGATIRNVYAQQAFGSVIVDDQTAGSQVLVGGSAPLPMRFLHWYSSPVAVGSGGIQSTGRTVGVQQNKLGISVAATGTMTVGEGNYFVISGSTQINNISTAPVDSGRAIDLTFSGTPIVATGGNLKLNSQFTAAGNTVLHLISDGTNWWGGRLS